MKRVLACVLFGVLLVSARADDAPPVSPAATEAAASAALAVMPTRMGYALDQPEILIRQRLFGLAHGLSMLAATCLDLPEHSRPVQDAYAAWHAKQGKTIEIIVHDLADYYFGPRSAEAQWPDLSRALNLRNSIEPLLGEVTLHAACASLPAAIVRPRYELGRILKEGLDRPVDAVTPPVAVSPAPTSATPAQ